MARISAFNNFRFDFVNPDSMNVGTWLGQPVITPTSVRLPTDAGVFELQGTGFSFNYQTGTATGTATGLTFSQNGRVVASITEINITASEVLGFAQDSNGAYRLVDSLLSGNDTFVLGSSNDVVFGGAGSDIINGGGGVDTVTYNLSVQNFTIGNAADTVSVSQGGFTDTLIDVERVEFADRTLALDTTGTAGQAYRLYQAAFDRAPDQAGLGYWIRELDAGNGDMAWMANNFIISNEFRSTYGTPESVSNADFMTLIYANVLDRTPDQAGFDYWVNELANGFDRGRVLASFSESLENQANVADAIQDGIWFV